MYLTDEDIKNNMNSIIYYKDYKNHRLLIKNGYFYEMEDKFSKEKYPCVIEGRNSNAYEIKKENEVLFDDGFYLTINHFLDKDGYEYRRLKEDGHDDLEREYYPVYEYLFYEIEYYEYNLRHSDELLKEYIKKIKYSLIFRIIEKQDLEDFFKDILEGIKQTYIKNKDIKRSIHSDYQELKEKIKNELELYLQDKKEYNEINFKRIVDLMNIQLKEDENKFGMSKKDFIKSNKKDEINKKIKEKEEELELLKKELKDIENE